jgi:hypothetical protein
MSFKVDYANGKSNEEKILNKINEYFNDDIKHIKYKYSLYDYEGKNKKYELKTRNNLYNKFESVLISKRKLINNIILLFSFIDGLYYIEYDENTFKNFEYKNFKRFSRCDYNDKVDEVVYIPIKYLKLIS